MPWQSRSSSSSSSGLWLVIHSITDSLIHNSPNAFGAAGMKLPLLINTPLQRGEIATRTTKPFSTVSRSRPKLLDSQTPELGHPPHGFTPPTGGGGHASFSVFVWLGVNSCLRHSLWVRFLRFPSVRLRLPF